MRARKAELLKSFLPKIRILLSADLEVVRPSGLFAPEPEDIWLEIGFGGGEHLAEVAAANPDVGFIGCEPFVNGVAGLLVKMADRHLTNVRIFPDDARLLLDALPDRSIGRCFVLFGDPWPKKRHADRRFIGPENLDRLARVLKPGAELRLASDDRGLVRWMLEHTWRHPAFEWLARRAEDWRHRRPDWPPTRYEAKALAAGRGPVYLRFRRCG